MQTTPRHDAPRLLIIGGGTAHQREDGQYVAKDALARYLHGMLESFEVCTWLVIRERNTAFSAPVPQLVDVQELGGVRAEWIRDCLRAIRLAKRHTHVLYFLPIHLAPVAPILRLMSHRFVVYSSVDYLAAIEIKRAERGWVWAFASKWASELPIRVAHSVIARGHHLARMARRLCHDVHETIPMSHGPTTRWAQLQPNGEVPLSIAFVGKVIRGKGVSELVQAMAILRDSYHLNIVCEIGGTGEAVGEVKALAHKLGIEECLRFRGWLGTSEELDEVYSAAAAVVVPSTFTEGVPRVIDEAIARGLPVVASAVGGIASEYVRGEVILVPPGDVASLAAAIAGILCDGEQRRRLLEAGRTRREALLNSISPAQQHAAILLA